MAEVPHLAFPLRITSGTFAAVEQDTIEDVRQCVHVLLSTPIGARPLAPEIGVEDPTFTEGIDPELMQAMLEEQEDRAAITVAVALVSGTGEQHITVDVQLAEDPADTPDDEPADDEEPL